MLPGDVCCMAKISQTVLAAAYHLLSRLDLLLTSAEQGKVVGRLQIADCRSRLGSRSSLWNGVTRSKFQMLSQHLAGSKVESGTLSERNDDASERLWGPSQ